MPSSEPQPTGKNATATITAIKKPPSDLPYKFVPASEKFFGCCSQRAGCIIIGVSQIFLGSVATAFQIVLAVMARGGIDLTKFFGAFPKEDSIKKFIFGVSVVDILSKVVFVVSGVVIIFGAAKRNASMLNAWMCINSYTFASSIATNAAAAGGLISFAESREEYAVPLTFDTLLMGAQFYVMSIVKGYHKHLEKAEEALKKANDGKTVEDDDHDIYHSSTVFKCWNCCLYEEKLQKQRTRVDNMKAWQEAEKERRSSIKGHAAEAEQKKLMNRALDAERKYQRLLLQQALREEQNRRQRNDAEWPGLTQPPFLPWPPQPPQPQPPPPPGWRGNNPNMRPGQPTVPPPGWTFPQPYPNRRPQGQQQVQPQPPKRPIQPPGPPQPPAGTTQPQPKPLIPQDGNNRPTEQNLRPSKGQGQGLPQSPITSKSGRPTSTLPSQDQKTKKSTKSKPSTATTSSRPTFTTGPTEDLDWQSLSEEPLPPRQSGVKSLSEPTGKPQNPSSKRRHSK